MHPSVLLHQSICETYPLGFGVIVKVLRPLQVGAVKTADGDCQGKTCEMKRCESIVADGEAGFCHVVCALMCVYMIARSLRLAMSGLRLDPSMSKTGRN